MTKTSSKTGGNRITAPLQNMNILDELVEKARSRARHLPGIVGFSGPSGFGKSTAAAYIAAEHGAYYLECKSSWTKKALLTALLNQMGLPAAKITHEMIDQVSAELATSQRTLIIDEFDHAIERGLIETVRDIYEGSKCPIVIIGEERIPLKLQKWERFHGRIMAWSQAMPADLDDARALNHHYSPNVRLEDELLQYLVELANGSVRRIVTNLDTIARYAMGEQLKTIGLAQWGARELHTGTPPKMRTY